MMCPIVWMDGRGAMRETHLLNTANEVEIIRKKEAPHCSAIIESLSYLGHDIYWLDNEFIYFESPNLTSHIDYLYELLEVIMHLEE
jgi:hypothetical protein